MLLQGTVHLIITLFTEHRKLCWHFPGYLDQPVIRGRRDTVFCSRTVTVMRKGAWKLYLYHEEWLLDGGAMAIDHNNTIELYHLKADKASGIILH